MYEFHYHHIKKNKLKLLFTDTYSLMYQIKTKDVYEDFCSNKEMFHFSNYSTQSKYYDDSNKSIIRKKEDKARGFALKEIVWLKTKMYSLLVDRNKLKKRKVQIKMLLEQ